MRHGWSKCRHSVKRVISSAKEKKQKECASELNDPEHRNDFFSNGKADGKRKTGYNRVWQGYQQKWFKLQKVQELSGYWTYVMVL